MYQRYISTHERSTYGICCFPLGPPPVPAAAVVIRPALPATLPRTAAAPRAPLPRLKTAAVTAMTAPALPPPPRLPPVLTPIPTPRAVLIKGLRRREKRRNEGQTQNSCHVQ